MSKTIDATEERELCDAVKHAVDLVDSGLSPDAAVEKVARDGKFGPGRIRLLGHAYNTGCQLRQWQDGGGILDKLASFTVCDPENVIRSVYGATKEAADGKVATDAYAPPPSYKPPSMAVAEFEKVAFDWVAPTVAPVYGQSLLTKAYGAVARQKRAADELNRLGSVAEDATRTAVLELTGYFRKRATDRVSFKDAEAVARTYHGEKGNALMDLVYKAAALREPRLGDTLPVVTGHPTYDFMAHLVAGCVKAAEDAYRYRSEAKNATEKVATIMTEAFRPFTHAPVAAEPVRGESDDLAVKAASLFSAPAMGTTMGTFLGRTLGSGPKTKDDLIEDAWMDLESPDHENEMRKIQANAMITSMMTDEDDPISGHDPARVLEAYNEISQSLPRGSTQAGIVRPLLRRKLEGNQEPFEAKELLDIEKGLAQTRGSTPNTNLLGDTPDKIMG